VPLRPCAAAPRRQADSTSFGLWACPHHSCATCGRKAAAAGGLLFRCAVCPQAFCEDHLPAEALIMGECQRFQDLGCLHPKQARLPYTWPCVLGVRRSRRRPREEALVKGQ